MIDKIDLIREEIAKVVVGQKSMIDGLLIGLLTNGHILVEGIPGLAKTTTIKALSLALKLEFKRVQFTPDLLPSDIIGAEIYDPKDSSFKIKRGPIFTQLLLADEINRSPSKVQSALLEAMQERQVTIGDKSFKLPSPFMVMATQNPLEQEGIYRLPEAQLDRFMMKILITHNRKEQELEIVRRVANRESKEIEATISSNDLEIISKEIESVHIDKQVEEYIIDLVTKTREKNPDIRYGVGVRASIDLYRASKAYAYLNRKDFVTPVDIITMSYPVFRHRLGLSYEAKAKGLTSDMVIKDIIDSIDMP